MTFDRDYVRIVLNENFEDAKRLLIDPMLAIDEAHLVMLADTGILSGADARALRAALATIDADRLRTVAYDGTDEDLFFYVERLIRAACDPDVAGRLHTARSRNDIAVTMYRMQLRRMLLTLAGAACDLRASLLGLAREHVRTVFAAHTHTQPAQPTTVAHYLLGAVEALERDDERLAAAYRSVNQCPLGACAITGTAFPIRRDRTAALLGFEGPTGNTYGSIATVDHLVEATSAAVVLVVGVGRVVQDLLLWCTKEVDYLRLADGFVQTSSIMPQKRNPVALEHARALASKAFAQLQGVPVAVHNTPFGDIVDTEDDLQPLVASAFGDATRAVALVSAALRGASLNVARMHERAGQHGVSITELADTLVRDHGVSFRVGHGIAARMVEALDAGGMSPSDLLRTASREVLGREIVLDEATLRRVLSPDHFVEVRRTPGGPSPELVRGAIQVAEVRLARDRAAHAGRRIALDRADAARAAALAAL